MSYPDVERWTDQERDFEEEEYNRRFMEEEGEAELQAEREAEPEGYEAEAG